MAERREMGQVCRQPIPIVLLLQDLEFGGTQRYAINLLKNMDRSLFTPELWVLRGGDDMLPLARDANVKITWLSRSSFVGPWAIVHLFIKLIRSQHKILYTLTVVPNIWGRIFGRIAGIPVIVSGYRNLFPKQHERWLWRFSSRIICNAHALKEVMTRHFSVDPGKISVILNGVEDTFFAPLAGAKSSEPTVLFVGRLIKAKNPHGLLEAFGKVLSVIPRARLEIVGNGPLEKELRAIIKKKSWAERVHMFPAIRDVIPFFARAWVFALPSITSEGSPNAIIEAMATGLPVVTMRVSGMPELVIDGQTGFLIDPGDPQGLANALIQLLKNNLLRDEMGRRGRERAVTHHSLAKVVKQTEDLLLEAMTCSGRQDRTKS